MKKITIKTKEKIYNIEIKFNLFKKKLNKIVSNNNKKFILIDRKVEYLLKNTKFPNNVFIIKINGSEKIKDIKNYQIIITKLLSLGIDRESTIIAIGGGTVGDICGFIASTVLRGVKFILFPTTLLSQVDSSIGGKNGINTKLGKNLIGTFYQPDKVFIDPKILVSLPNREIKSGYAEIVKHALIRDFSFFIWLDKNYNKIFKLKTKELEYAIYKSIKIKAKFVNTDPKEKLKNKHSRALLNFGHTYGHALETLHKYKNTLTHGESISIGMIIASKISNNISSLKKKQLEMIINHFNKVGLPIDNNSIKSKKIFKLIKKDKKNIGNKINLILLKKIGEAYYCRNVDQKKISKIIN